MCALIQKKHGKSDKSYKKYIEKCKKSYQKYIEKCDKKCERKILNEIY